MPDPGTPLDAAREAATLAALVLVLYALDSLTRALVS